MPRQKFCSVPGCLSTTELIKKEQETFLSEFCNRCEVVRPCRCPAPDIFTTRKETRSKFASWCGAIGLKDPGYYINVCYKHFSLGCPSRNCPNPDVVVPVWEKHIRDRMNNNHLSPHSTRAPLKRAHSSGTSSPASSPSPTAKIKSIKLDQQSSDTINIEVVATKSAAPNFKSHSASPLSSPIVEVKDSDKTAPLSMAPMPNLIQLPSVPILRPVVGGPRPTILRSGSTGSTHSSTASSPEQENGNSSDGSTYTFSTGRSTDTNGSLNRVLPPNIRHLLSSLLQNETSHSAMICQTSINATCSASLARLTLPVNSVKVEAMDTTNNSNNNNSNNNNNNKSNSVTPMSTNMLSLKPLPLNALISSKAPPSVVATSKLPTMTQIKVVLPQTPLPISSVRDEPDKFNTPLPNLVTKIATPSILSPTGHKTIKREMKSPLPEAKAQSYHPIRVATPAPTWAPAPTPTPTPVPTPVPAQPHHTPISHGISLDLNTIDYEDELDFMEIPFESETYPIKTEIDIEENPLLDQSEDPCLNEGHNLASSTMVTVISSPFSDDLDLVNKWLDICEDERNKS